MWEIIWSVSKDHLTLKSMNINDNIKGIESLFLKWCCLKKKKKKKNALACDLNTVIVRKEFRPESFE